MQPTQFQCSDHAEDQNLAPSIVIVGAGPTGLTAANLLGQVGIRTLVLERNANLSDCPKAITIDDDGLRICQAIELSNDILKHVVLGIEAHFLSSHRFLGKVAPTTIRNRFPQISTFHQPTFEAILLKGLLRFPCVEVRFLHTLDTFTQNEKGVTLHVSTSDGRSLVVCCDYLLACDGGKSSIRHALSIAMHRPTLFPSLLKRGRQHRDTGQRWLVVDTIDDDTSATAATFFCEPARPVVTVPAPHRTRRWEFMLRPEEHEGNFTSHETIQQLIRQARSYHPIMSTIKHTELPRIVRKTIYTFHAAVAQRFQQGRVFLLGDAAHLMPPFGGQGMNSGLRDAYNLCWKLKMVLKQQAPSKLLETYFEERYPHVREMIVFSSLLGNIVMATTSSVAWYRDRFFELVNHIPPLRNLITEQRVKPQSLYRRGFLFRKSEGTSQLNRLVGRLLPQMSVSTQHDMGVPLDVLLSNTFVVLRLYEEPEQAFTSMPTLPIEGSQVRHICVLPQGTPLSEVPEEVCETVRDVDGTFASLLHHRQDSILLIRPDHYIAGVFAVKVV